MIQLSSIPAASPDFLAPTVPAAVPEGLFASLLVEGLAEPAAATGKILPASGKPLLDALPLEAQIDAPVAPELPKMLASAVAKPKIETAAIAPVLPLPGLPFETGAEAAPDSEDVPALAEAAMPGEAELPADPVPMIVAAIPVIQNAPPVAVPVEAGSQPGAAPQPQEADAQPAAEPAPVVSKDAAQPRQPVVLPPIALALLAKAGEPVAKSAAAPVEPGVASLPASSEAARTAAPVRMQPVAELKLALSAEGRPSAPGDLPSARPVSATVAFDTAAAPTATIEPAPALTATKPAFDAAAQVRPHDLAQLVDRLVEVRENARIASAAVSVMHADFGEVSMRFGQENGNLTVSLANNDPGFARAVNAAVATDALGNGETAHQGERRDGGQGTAARNADAQLASSDRGNGRERDGRPGRDERADRPFHDRAQDGGSARRSRDGIFA